MELYVNGKSFSIEEKMQKAFEKAASLSHDENCLEIYVKDEGDSNFDAIVFFNPVTNESEIIYIPFLNEAIGEKFFNYRKLFLSSMIKTGSLTDVKSISLSEMLSLNKSAKPNLSDIFVELKDGSLLIYVPGLKEPSQSVKSPSTFKKDAMNYMAAENTRKLLQTSKTVRQPVQKPVQQSVNPISTGSVRQENITAPKRENIFTKKLSPAERRAAVSKYLDKTEDSLLVYAALNKAVYRVNKVNGEAKKFTLQVLMDNPNLGINSADDILTLGIFDISIKNTFKFVSCCDIRTAFTHFPNPMAPVSGVNYVVDGDVLYIVFASPEDVSKGITLKDYSIQSYMRTNVLWPQIEEKFDSYDTKVFYVHRNSNPDCVAICTEKTKTTEFKTLEEAAAGLENFSLNLNSDLSVGFPKDRIFDLNEYGTENVELIRVGSMKVIDACDIKQVRDDDEISTGYDKKNNVCFYCAPKF